MHSGTQLPLQQHPNFADALRLIGSDVYEIGIIGAAPVQTIVRFGLRFASRGPVWHKSSKVPDALELRRSGLRLINSDGGGTAAKPACGARTRTAIRVRAAAQLLRKAECLMVFLHWVSRASRHCQPALEIK